MKRGGWLAVAVLAPRLVALFVNENLAGDAIARTWIAHRWLEAPHFMTSFDDGPMQFGPLHLYLLALAEVIWPSLLHAGRVLSLVVGALTAWPLYTFTARRFGTNSATIAVLGFAFWGLHVQCSTTSASEALNLLFVMFAIALFDEERPWLAALMLNFACATRYDSWLLVPLLATAELWRSRNLLKAFGFGAAASGFAIFWLIGNQLGQGDALYPIRFIDQFHRDWWPREAAIWGDGAYRLMCLLFWPGAAVMMLTPLFATAGVVGVWRSWKERPELRWLVLLIVIPTALYTFRSAVTASFAPLARFTMKEVLLLLPFAGWALAERPSVARASVTMAGLWCIGLGVYCYDPGTRWSYTFRSIAATSRLEPSLRVPADWLKANAAPKGGLLVADQDPREFDDLVLTYFSGFGFNDQVRRRHRQYEELLGARRPRWLLLFDGGRMTSEVMVIDPEHLEYRGAQFELRHSSRVRIFEQL